MFLLKKFVVPAILFSALLVACRDGGTEQKKVEGRAVSSSVVSEPSSSSLESSSSEESSSSVEEISSQSVSSSSVAESSSSVKKVEPVQESSSSEALAVEDSLSEDTVVVDLCADAPKGRLCDKRDGKRYRIATLGSQVWMAENLNFESENSWCYENQPKNCAKYGRLYQWTSALALESAYLNTSAADKLTGVVQGICPEGWHVPSNSDMEKLAQYVESKNERLKNERLKYATKEGVGTSLKSDSLWFECGEDETGCIKGTNRYDFNAFPAGYRERDGSFVEIGEDTGFWVAEESEDVTRSPYWDLYYSTDKFWGRNNNSKSMAYSVRCLQN